MTRAFFTRCAAPPHGGGRSSSPASPSSPPDHATPPGDADSVPKATGSKERPTDANWNKLSVDDKKWANEKMDEIDA